MEIKNSSYSILLLFCLIIIGCRPNQNVISEQDTSHKTLGANEVESSPIKDTLLAENANENRYKVVPIIDSIKYQYEIAYQELERMLSGKQHLDFKRAVFITENAYCSDSLDFLKFYSEIDAMSEICKGVVKNVKLKDYRYSDSLNLKKNYAIFSIIKDTVYSSKYISLAPFEYKFQENRNELEWTDMFVTKLISTKAGNCHSLPYLYKILANEIGAEAFLSLAPNHIYLKHRSKQLGWYNTELTSGQFPSDAWVKASGYVTIDAIRNGIYMDTLGQQQSIALCAYDLAMGYSKKTGKSLDGFVVKCCDLALKYHPENVNAIILKAETLKKNYEFYIKSDDSKSATKCFSEMRELYVMGVRLGYREIPKEMYLAWLQSSTNAKNSSINNTFNVENK